MLLRLCHLLTCSPPPPMPLAANYNLRQVTVAARPPPQVSLHYYADTTQYIDYMFKCWSRIFCWHSKGKVGRVLLQYSLLGTKSKLPTLSSGQAVLVEHKKCYSKPTNLLSHIESLSLLAASNKRYYHSLVVENKKYSLFFSPKPTVVLQANQMSNNNSNSTKNNSHESELRKKFKPKDIRFKTPYGHLAALEWGHAEAPHKILCIHGWLDNAGSFERLVPFILDHEDNHKLYHIIAMDMPGVGLSSHKPAGAEYATFTNIMEMRRVVQQMGWQKVTLLSHSLGSHFSYLYSCVYPDQVETLISIDLAHPLTRQVHNWNVTIANSIEEHFKCEYHHEDDPTTNIRVPVYSEVDALKRLMDGHSNSLTRESAEVLLKRGAKKQRWGYTFNRDVRLRYLSLEMRPDDDLMLQFLRGPFRPNLFIIRANRSPYHRPEEVRLKYYELFKKNCPLFRDVIADGTHHLHMNTPDTVAIEINKFLDDARSVTGRDGNVSINKSNL